MKQTRFLSQEGLKLIACVTMLLDHIGATLYPSLHLRAIGRLAFPIYCFLLAEGLRHSQSKGKYLLRMGIGLVLSELPFDMLFYSGFTWAHQSVMFTLGLGCLMGFVMEKIPYRPLKCLAAIPFYFAAEWLHTDYGGIGVLMVALFILTEELPANRFLQAIGLLILNSMLDSASITFFGLRFSVQLLGTLAIIPICLYSGQKLTRSRLVQWGFYLWYPAHLSILYILYLLKRIFL